MKKTYLSASLVTAVLSISIPVILFAANTCTSPSIGMSGPSVRAVQQFLTTQYSDYTSDYVTGYFGPVTQDAVKQWQGEHGISQSGIVGPQTRAAMKITCTPIPTTQTSSQSAVASNTTASQVTFGQSTGQTNSSSSSSYTSPNPSSVSSTDSSLQSLIQSLYAQISDLQKKIAQFAGGATPQQTGQATAQYSNTTTGTTQAVTQTTTSTTQTTVQPTVQTTSLTTSSQSASQTPASCTFNSQTIANGQSLTAYQSSSVAYGSTCQQQTRTCSNGTLSGSYVSTTCSVQGASSCQWNGQTIANGQSITAYQASSVAYGSTCQQQNRSCGNGSLSGTYSFATCSVSAAAPCTFNGQTIASGQSITAYDVASVTSPDTCAAHQQSRSCTNGNLSGTGSNTACTLSQAATQTQQTVAPTYAWTTGDWNQCSQGQQVRTVGCWKSVGTSSKQLTDDSFCAQPKPQVSQSCAVLTNTNGTLSPSNYTWTTSLPDLGNNGRWQVAMSGDGSTIVTSVYNSNDYMSISAGAANFWGHIDISRDGGSTFSKVDSAGWREWRGIAMSTDGRVMAAFTQGEPSGANGYLYISKDSGSTWVRQDAVGNINIGSVAISGNGNTIGVTLASGAAYVIVSTDGGATWRQSSMGVSSVYPRLIAANADGTKLAVAATDPNKSNQTDYVFLSIDSGSTWSNAFTANMASPAFAAPKLPGGLGMSASGADIVMATTDYNSDGTGSGSDIYVSHDGGGTWNAAYHQKNNFRGAAISADGRTIAATDMSWDSFNVNNLNPDGILYHVVTSNDGGATWQSNTLPRHYFDGVAINPDGSKIVVVNTGGGIYIGTRSNTASLSSRVSATPNTWSSSLSQMANVLTALYSILGYFKK